MLQNQRLGFLAAILGMAVVTAICALLGSRINEMTAALAMLLTVLFIAAAWGRWPGLVASMVGMLCLNYFFLPPTYTFTIADPQNWTALTAFFITAFTAGQLSVWVRQRAAEAEASRSKARLASAYNLSLLEASLDPLVTIGRDGKINDVNAAAERVTGRSRGELIGADFADCFTNREKARTAHELVFRGATVRGYTLELRHRDGHSTSILYDGSLYKDGSGNVIGVVAAMRPISTYAGKSFEARPAPRVVIHLSLFVGLVALFSIAVGLLSLGGLTFGFPVLKSVIPGQPVIKFNAAVCLVFLGLSLWLRRRYDQGHFHRARKVCAQSMAAITALVGILSLAEHLFGWDLRIDQLLFREPVADAFFSIRPGLIAPITALDFVLLGAAILLLDQSITWRSRHYWPAQYLAALTAILAIVGLLDFVLESSVSYTHISLQTAVTLLLLSLGLLCARTERGLAALLASSALGGALTRRLLPAAIIIPVVIGAVGWRAFSAGLYSGWSVVSLMIIAMITLLAGFAIWNGYLVNRTDVERQRAEGALHRREIELREAERLAGIGSWWWDPKIDSVTWSAGLCHLAWRDPILPPLRYREHLAFYTPESSTRLDAAIQSTMQSGAPHELELEMVRTDGAIRSVAGRGEVERDAEGNVVVARGIIQDVTERKQAEEALRESEGNLNRAQEIAHIGSWHLDVTRNRLTWSDEVFRIFGVPRETALTYDAFVGMIHPEDRASVDNAWTAALHGDPYDIEHRVIVDGKLKWVRERALVEFDKEGKPVSGTGTVQDVTERKLRENEIRLLALRQAVVAELGQQALRSEPLERVLDEAVAQVAQTLDIEYCKVLELLPHGNMLLLRSGVGWKEGLVGHATVSASVDSQAGFTLQSANPVVVEDLPTEQRFSGPPLLHEHGVVSGMSVIISTAEGPYGVLGAHTQQRRTFTEDEINFLQSVANVLGTMVERRRGEEELRTLNAELEQRVLRRTAQLQAANKELEQVREREIEIGFRIQQTLLLDQPPEGIPGLRVAALTIPSQRIDGDFYVFLQHSNECLDVIVGDVMGKGIPAALLSAATKSHFLRALGDLMSWSRGSKLPEPKEIVMLAHAELVRHLIDLDSFVTLCYARFDLAKCSLDFVDCGHTGIVRLHGKTGLHETLHGDNLPLGVREGEIYDQMSVSFEPGDLFVFYSDGVTEARSATGELFGPRRLEECILSNGQLEPGRLVEAVRQTVATFAGSGRPSDDLTSVAIRVQERQLPIARQGLEIGSDLRQLRQARQFVRAFCSNLPGPPVDEDSVAALELAVNEAASNIMKHAYHGRKDQWIHLEAEAFPDHLAFQLHHFGDAFDPSTAPPPPLDGSRESGFGAYIIASKVDEVRYYRDERGRSCIALTKARKTGGREE